MTWNYINPRPQINFLLPHSSLANTRSSGKISPNQYSFATHSFVLPARASCHHQSPMQGAAIQALPQSTQKAASSPCLARTVARSMQRRLAAPHVSPHLQPASTSCIKNDLASLGPSCSLFHGAVWAWNLQASASSSSGTEPHMPEKAVTRAGLQSLVAGLRQRNATKPFHISKHCKCLRHKFARWIHACRGKATVCACICVAQVSSVSA